MQLLQAGKRHPETGICGWAFGHGAMGLFACGDGRYYISQNHVSQSGQCGLIYRYVWDEKCVFVMED